MKGLFLLFLTIFVAGCEKGDDATNSQLIAKVVGFDYNCSTCILQFPFDSALAAERLGNSNNAFYNTANLNRNDFNIGQLIKVNVRKAENTELRACITMYPSNIYQSIYVTDYEYFCDFEYNDTIDLGYGKCVNDYNNQLTFCFDTVLTDSRCPVNVTCIWAGEAIARFRINNLSNEPVFVDLHTGIMDTVIYGYKISFLDLLPYPNTEIQRDINDYKARIIIKKNIPE